MSPLRSRRSTSYAAPESLAGRSRIFVLEALGDRELLDLAQYQEFCDRVGRKAVERGLTKKKLTALLADDDAHRARAHRR